MIRAAFLFVLIGLSIWLAVWFADNPGRVNIEIAGLRIGTKTGVLVFGLLLFAVLSAAGYRLWRFVRRTPGQIGQLRGAKRRQRGYQALTQGMVAVAAGEADEAVRFAGKANSLLKDPPLTMLLSAQAAQLQGDEDAARRYFESMLEEPDMAFLGLRGLLMQAIRQNDTVEALRLANQAYTLRPDTPWVSSRLFELQAGTGQWESADKTLSHAVRVGALDAESSRRHRAIIAVALSDEAADADDSKEAIKRARAAYDLDPGFTPVTVAYVRHLAAAGRARKAKKMLETAWASGPHPDLAAAYIALGDADEAPLDRVKRIQHLYNLRPDDNESRLVLAEAAIAAALWGEARRHLDAVTGDQSSGRFCRLMADLEAQGNGDAEAARQWRDKAALAPPDDAWQCGECGSIANAWAPSCGHCGTFGGLRWHQSAGVPALPNA